MKKADHNTPKTQETSSVLRAGATASKSGNKAGATISSSNAHGQAFRTEKAMQRNEGRIPELAADAVKQARANTLNAGRSVVEVVDGKLVETHPDGSFKVIRSIASPTVVVPDKKLIRKVK